MAGDHVLSYVPRHKSALELEPGLKGWLQNCWSKELGELKFQEPKDWFKYGYKGDNFVSSPAPAAAEVASEQMA
jgi:hypothetical protein